MKEALPLLCVFCGDPVLTRWCRDLGSEGWECGCGAWCGSLGGEAWRRYRDGRGGTRTWTVPVGVLFVVLEGPG